MPSLLDYVTGATIREATPQEALESEIASYYDGGAGVIEADGRRCYVPVTSELPGVTPTQAQLRRLKELAATYLDYAGDAEIDGCSREALRHYATAARLRALQGT